MLSFEQFNRLFKIVPTSIIDPWQDLSNVVAPKGDCQDYALSILSIETGGHPWRYLLTGRALIWRAWSPVGGKIPRHAILWVKGKGWIDSGTRRWRASPDPCTRVYPINLPFALGIIWTLGLYMGWWTTPGVLWSLLGWFL